MPSFYVGQHESYRERPVTDDLVRRAHECGVSLAAILHYKVLIFGSMI